MSKPLVDAFEALDGRCIVCLMMGTSSPNHALFGCPNFNSLPRMRSYTTLNRGIRYHEQPTFPVCYTCHLPLGLDGLPHPNVSGTRGRPEDCPHADVLKPVSFVVRQGTGTWMRGAEGQFSQDWSGAAGDEAFVKWLTRERKESQGSRGLTNMQELFVWVMSVLREREAAEADDSD